MTVRTFSVLAGLLAASPLNAQMWQAQTGVMPSYRQPAPKPTLRIANQTALEAALSRAKGGEVIGLAPGNYGLSLRNRTFPAMVTITSANPARPATITWLKLTDVSNLSFSRLTFSRVPKAGESTEGTYIGKVEAGRNIVFDGIYAHGSLDNDATNDMTGFNIGGTRNAKVINSEFQQLGRAAVFGAVSGVVVANNKIHQIRSDGFNFAQSDHVLIEGNHFSDSQRIKKDHPDAIQFWTARTKRPSTDIVIRNNQIIQGQGSGTQGIFIKDDVGSLPYERITIENNLIIASNMANGIYVLHAKDVNIVNNTVISPTDDENPVWIKTISVENLKLEGNIADVGGNRTPHRAKIDMSLLKKDRYRGLKAQDVIVPGIGYQLKQ